MRPSILAACRRSAALALTVLAACQAAPEAAEDGDHQASFPPTNRPEVRGTGGAVSSDHPLATAVGLDVLRRGGNATDAVIAMAGVLAVVRPHMNGVGGDAFGLFYDGASGEVVALNGSGGAGARATPEFFADLGHSSVPETGPLSVSVPGAVSAWDAALSRFGTLPLAELLEPAARYAEEGFPVSTRLASDFEEQGVALNDHGRAKYLPGGGPPEPGSLLTNQALAQTLRAIGREGREAFYGGPTGRRLAAFVDSLGGTLTPDDFASHQSEWVDPLAAEYLGHRLFVLPPNTQGVTQLAYARMANTLSLREMVNNTSSCLHAMIELKKLAFADRDAWVGDPRFASIPVDAMLDEGYLTERSGHWDPSHAADLVESGVDGAMAASSPDTRDDAGDTVYLTAVDQWGNAVSWIQSLFHGFGSGLLEPQTGVLLHNRGSLYTLVEGHPNQVAPGKRPYHTLTPLLATGANGTFAFTLGTPGGDSQTQSLLQIMNNMELFGMTPQAAIEAPRFRSNSGLSLALEDRVAPHVVADLRGLGHDVSLVSGWTATFGGAQMILREPNGTLVAAADPRREAYALAY